VEIELADAVAAVREELFDAARRGVGQEVAFVVGPIEMEFAVELRADASCSRPAGSPCITSRCAWLCASARSR
jgi:hypothetical protein